MKKVFCETCGECLGEERPNYAKEHLRQFPNHKSFLVKTLYDPLLLENPDDWFKKYVTNRRVTPTKTTDEVKESAIRNCYLIGCFFLLLISVGEKREVSEILTNSELL